MKKIIFLLLLIVTVSSTNGQVTKIWEKSASNNDLPAWFDTGNLTRGFAYGEVDGNDRLYVVSRNGGNYIFILDAATGDSLGMLDASGVSGGTYHISDVAVSDDGKIFLCNLSLGGNFKVYMWENENDTAMTVIDKELAGRHGDKLSVSGSVADNSVAIWSASANSNEVIKFTTADNAATFSADTIDIGETGGSASVGSLEDGSFYYNATGKNPMKFDAEGNLLGTVSGEVVSTASNSIRYLMNNYGNEYFVTFQYGTGNENARVVKVPNGDLDMASTFALTSSMQVNGNANGTGDVAVQKNDDGSFNIYVLSTNNGLQAYKFMPDLMDNFQKWSLTDTEIPSYFGGNTERGMAYGEGYVYVVSRNGAEHFVYVHNAATGELVDTIAAPAERTGYFPVNAAEYTDGGKLLVCNMTLNADETNPFMVYSYNKSEAKWDTLLSYSGGGRMGDMFSAYGNSEDNSLTVYAGAKSTDKLVQFVTDDNGMTFTANEITLADMTLGTVPNVAQANDGTIYVKSYAQPLVHFNTDGTIVDTISTEYVATGATKVLYKEVDGRELIFSYLPDIGGGSDLEKVSIVDITDEPEFMGYTPSLGAIANGNGSGSVEVGFKTDGTMIMFVMGTNNGIATFTEEDLFIPVPTVAELEEDFEGEWLSEGWVTFAANVEAGDPTDPWAQSSYKPYSGDSHAYMGNYNTKSDCYLVTPALDLNSELNAFHFFVQDDWNDANNDFGSMLKVMVSTGSQTDPADFVVIDSVKESDCYDVVLNKVIDLSAIEGDYAYIAFVVSNFGDPNNPNAGGDNWIIDNIRMDSTFTDVEDNNSIPNEFALEQNYPNPFNPTTKINFSLKVNAKVKLKIYDVLGQEVKTLVNKDMSAGKQSVNFNASNLSSGMYIYRLEAKGTDGFEFNEVKKMMLLK